MIWIILHYWLKKRLPDNLFLCSILYFLSIVLSAYCSFFFRCFFLSNVFLFVTLVLSAASFFLLFFKIYLQTYLIFVMVYKVSSRPSWPKPPCGVKNKTKENKIMKNNSNSNNILLLCQAALIAALYIVLTFLANAMGLANYAVQVRFSEALTILPFFHTCRNSRSVRRLSA